MTFENFIPPRSKSVLEVTGEVPANFETSKKNFLEIQPACKYSVEKILPKSKNKFDTIILQSAVIGNLENSELVKLIKAAAKLLNSRGRLIFILDNVSYIDNVMAILEGKPLTFKVTLSKVELDAAIKNAGLNICTSMNAARRVAAARSLVENAKVDMSVFAYIISATPEELPKPTSIQTITGEKKVCGAKRVFDPLSFMATEPNVTNFFYDIGQPYRIWDDKDFKKRIFINQRMSFNTFTEGKHFFGRIKELGYLYIDEMDDHPVRWKDSYENTGNINFVGVHGIQTSTEYLAEYFRQFNPNVKIFPNHLRNISPLRDFKNQKKAPTRIFFGALNRDEEFRDLLPLLNKIAQKYGEKIEFKILANKELFEDLEAKNKTLIGDPEVYNGQFVPYEKYLETLQETDIALLPLLDNEFNRSKSDLKFIECAACGAAVLASPVVYSNTIKDGANGLIYKDKKEFMQKLQILIDRREKRYEMATAAYNYVKNNRLLSQHYEERMDWYNELFAKLDELNEETQARIDKIAPNFKDEKPPEIQNTANQFEGNNGKNAEIIIPNEW